MPKQGAFVRPLNVWARVDQHCSGHFSSPQCHYPLSRQSLLRLPNHGSDRSPLDDPRASSEARLEEKGVSIASV